MSEKHPDYPDISHLLAQKAERRKAISRLSFVEKVAMMEALRERLAPLRALREARQREVAASTGPYPPAPSPPPSRRS